MAVIPRHPFVREIGVNAADQQTPRGKCQKYPVHLPIQSQSFVIGRQGAGALVEAVEFGVFESGMIGLARVGAVEHDIKRISIRVRRTPRQAPAHQLAGAGLLQQIRPLCFGEIDFDADGGHAFFPAFIHLAITQGGGG